MIADPYGGRKTTERSDDRDIAALARAMNRISCKAARSAT
jgi:hypothetical protein